MTDKKLTDEDVVEGLERCISTTTAGACVGYPFNKQKLCDKDQWTLERHALGLINRQKSEIERLHSMNRAKLDTIHDLQTDTNILKEQLQGVTEKFNCQQTVYTDLSKIIKVHKREIAKLKYENETLSINADNAFQDGPNEAQGLYAEQVKAEIKSEAYKEFAERIRECCNSNNELSADAWLSVTTDINCVLKEMVGEEE